MLYTCTHERDNFSVHVQRLVSLGLSQQEVRLARDVELHDIHTVMVEIFYTLNDKGWQSTMDVVPFFSGRLRCTRCIDTGIFPSCSLFDYHGLDFGGNISCENLHMTRPRRSKQ